VQPEGTLWIGRDFLAIEARAHAQLARLNVDASLDENFANADALVFVDGFEP
jgi:hypothetical protein